MGNPWLVSGGDRACTASSPKDGMRTARDTDAQREYFLLGVISSRIVGSHSKPVKSSRSNFDPTVRKQKSSLHGKLVLDEATVNIVVSDPGDKEDVRVGRIGLALNQLR